MLTPPSLNRKMEEGGSLGTRSKSRRERDVSQKPSFSLLYALMSIGMAFLIIWAYLHRTLVHNEDHHSEPHAKSSMMGGASGRSNLDAASVMHVQKLLDETKILLKDINAANVTLNQETLHDLSEIGHERNAVAEELSAIKHTSLNTQEKLHTCEIERAEEAHKWEGWDLEKKALLTRATDAEKGSSNSNSVDVSDNHHNSIDIAPPASQGHTNNKKYWLTIGIPTVSRAENQDYLLQTLASIRQQLPADPDDLLYHRIRVIVYVI